MYLELESVMPKMNLSRMKKETSREGPINRIIDFWQGFRKGNNTKSNIFIPTAALQLFTHINKIAPKNHLVLADFDSFIMPNPCVSGINAPIVTNKLTDPSSWDTFPTYLVPRGLADICFPTNFYFLEHAYRKIAGKDCQTLKNMEVFDEYAVSSWCETRNGFNPMKEEYINTSFLLS